jgi:hypothetical protein
LCFYFHSFRVTGTTIPAKLFTPFFAIPMEWLGAKDALEKPTKLWDYGCGRKPAFFEMLPAVMWAVSLGRL